MNDTYLCWDCAQTFVKNSRLHVQKAPHDLHLVGFLASAGGLNGIVLGGWDGGEQYPGVSAGRFCNCKLGQMNITFVLCGRRDGAQAAAF